MKNRIKSYLVFTSMLYRVIMFLLVPIALAVIALWVGGGFGSAVIVLAAVLFPIIDILSDNWLFGGIQTKDAEKLDFLKTSGHGMDMMRNALRMDLIRKLLTVIIVQGVCWLVWSSGGREYGMPPNLPGAEGALRMVLFGVAVSWFFSVLGTFIARYGSMLWFNIMVGYIGMLLEMAAWFLAEFWEYHLMYSILYAVLGVLVSGLAVKAAMKKVEGSYYDK